MLCYLCLSCLTLLLHAAVPQALDLKSLTTKRHSRIVGCSAVTGDGLLDGFEWIVKDISSRIYLFDQ